MKFRKNVYLYGSVISLLVSGRAVRTAVADKGTTQTTRVQPKVGSSQEVEGFTLSLKIKKRGEATRRGISLAVTLKDVNRQNVRLQTGEALVYKLEVLRPDGTLAPLTSHGKGLKGVEERFPRLHSRIFNPGDEHEVYFTEMQAFFDMTQVGDYYLRVSRSVPKRPENMKNENDKEATLYSNVIKIRVEAAKK